MQSLSFAYRYTEKKKNNFYFIVFYFIVSLYNITWVFTYKHETCPYFYMGKFLLFIYLVDLYVYHYYRYIIINGLSDDDSRNNSENFFVLSTIDEKFIHVSKW